MAVDVSSTSATDTCNQSRLVKIVPLLAALLAATLPVVVVATEALVEGAAACWGRCVGLHSQGYG
jgi:hypothetical protein